MTPDQRAAAQQLAAQRDDIDLQQVLATPEGRRVWWRLITRVCGAFSSDFELDSRLHAYQAGKRDVGMALVREAQRVAPKAYLEMTRERINHELRELEAAKASAGPAGNTSTS